MPTSNMTKLTIWLNTGNLAILIRRLNPLVAALFGPDHYNLEPDPDVPGDTMGRIDIEYIGPGKPFRTQNIVRR